MSDTSAYHEAGHALVAFRVGARVRSITIDPDWDDGPARHADTTVEWPRDAVEVPDFHEKSVLVALAGPVAEMIHTGDPFHPALVAEWSADWKTAWESAAALLADERKRLKYLEQKTLELYRLLNREDVWAALAAIVDELLAHETLEGEDVERVVVQWLG